MAAAALSDRRGSPLCVRLLFAALGARRRRTRLRLHGGGSPQQIAAGSSSSAIAAGSPSRVRLLFAARGLLAVWRLAYGNDSFSIKV
jgi:hypothetical protein